jgi:hypothetical protein
MFPWLRPRSARASDEPPPPRLVLLMQSNGTSQSMFWPRAGGAASPLSSPILDPLARDPALAPKTTVLKGLFNRDVGGAGISHDVGFAGLYSGFRTTGSNADPWGNGISLDQTLRRTLTFDEPMPTLNAGVLASDTPALKTHRRSFSYVGPRQPVPTEIDPYKLYARFFPGAPAERGNGGDPVAAAKRRLARKRTVLDYVAGDLQALRARAPRFDRERLEAHEDSLRQLERRLSATLLPDAGRPVRCGGVARPAEGLDVTAEDNVPLLAPLMLDFTALALTCRLTRIVTFQLGNGGEKWYFRWLGINENSHDAIAHRDDGTNADITAKVVKMNLWYAELVARLARALDAVPEPGGTALDNTLIVWGNEQATGVHTMDDIPVVLLGRAGGRLKATGTLVSRGPQDYHRLGATLLNVMGVPALGFGEAPDCGLVEGLELA